jgi:methylated-DNA-protein-cysteine methyltransferase-like protein
MKHPPKELHRQSPTYQAIYSVVRQIPRGRIATYGQVAGLAGLPGHARLVGYALHNLPGDTRIPWHRVINAQGKISLTEMDGMRDMQLRLLRREGVTFFKERTDFGRFGWLNNLQKKGIQR